MFRITVFLVADWCVPRGEIIIWEQAQLYKTLSAKDKLSASEQLKMTVCRQAMDSNDIRTLADIDRLREKTEKLNKIKTTR